MNKFLAVFSIMFFSSLAFAGLSVNPSVLNVSAAAGTEFENSYSVTSSYDAPMTMVIKISDGYTYSGNKDVKAENWLKFEKERYDIGPKETITVPFKGKVSEDMTGSVSAKVSFSVEQSSMINLAVTVPVYVTVKGTENVDFSINSLSLINNSRDGGIYYKMVVKNAGNVHIRHHGSIDIYTKNKKKLIKTVSIQETVPTYAGTDRTFSEIFVSKGTLEKGKYVAVFKISDLNKDAEKEIAFKVSKSGEVVLSK